MQPKFYKTDQFEKLKSKWYGKLKKSGFDDIEQDEKYLHIYSISNGSAGSLNQSLIVREAKEEYYRYAESFKNTSAFKKLSKRDKFAWRMHSKAIGFREIAARLKKKDPTLVATKDTVNATIANIKKEMFKLYGVSAKG